MEWPVVADSLSSSRKPCLKGPRVDCLQTNSQAGPQPMEEFLSSSGRSAQPLLLRTPVDDGPSTLQALQLDANQVSAR